MESLCNVNTSFYGIHIRHSHLSSLSWNALLLTSSDESLPLWPFTSFVRKNFGTTFIFGGEALMQIENLGLSLRSSFVSVLTAQAPHIQYHT